VNRTGANNVVRHYDADGNLLSPFALLALNEREAALLWWALYLAYGDERRCHELWAKLRVAVGEHRFEEVVKAGSEIGRERVPHPWDED